MYFGNKCMLRNAALILIAFNVVSTFSENIDCDESEIEYKYTECDAAHQRWRVVVPKTEKNCLVRDHPPIKGPDCDYTCEGGQYLDIKDPKQECKKCPAGYYSVGSGVLFDRWNTLPSEFSLKKSFGHSTFITNCSNSNGGWIPEDDILRGIPDGCLSSLVLPVKLIKNGKVTIQYKNTYQLSLSFFLQVRSTCQSNGEENPFKDGKDIRIFTQTSGEKFQTLKFDLVAGVYELKIYNLGVSSVAAPGSIFAIKSIEIQGMAFTMECNECPAGYYSSEGSSSCTECKENTFSDNAASSTCKACGDNEYALPGSRECKPSPPCTASDYRPVMSPCINAKTKITYDWMRPMFCNKDHPKSVKLPAPEANKDCPACNPGSALNSEGKCEFCKVGTYSDGSKNCTECPVHTEARRTLSYRRFEMLPEGMSTGCVQMSGGGSLCNKQLTWVPHSSYLQPSGEMGFNEYAILTIEVGGFSNTTIDGVSYGQLRILYDLESAADNPATLFVLAASKGGDAKTLMAWSDSGTQRYYQYNFTKTDITSINVAFKSASFNTPHENTVRLYQIDLVNTVSGGASECTECVGGSGDSCHTCGKGEFIKTNNVTGARTCESCPPNNILVDAYTCVKCADGLIASADFSQCLSNCKYTAPDNLKFDFSGLSGVRRFDGVSLFSGDGSSYYNSINFIICSPGTKAKAENKAICVANITDEFYWDTTHSVQSLVCKATIMPSAQPVSFQPTSLGDKLLNISYNDEKERRLLIDQGFQLDGDALTVHYNYIAEQPTERCMKGINMTITLVCDLHEKGNGTILFPPKCVGGTCDGCHYSLIWESALACPVCSESDFTKITGECVGGQQTIHYLPKKYCAMTEEMKQKQEVIACSVLTLPIKIGILCSSLVGVLLLVCAIYCWKRSRKLEYKYMRLVEGASGGNGELPAAQTCAWSDGEEEEEVMDKVAFKTKGDKLFGRLGSKKDDGFEKMKLVGSSLPEL